MLADVTVIDLPYLAPVPAGHEVLVLQLANAGGGFFELNEAGCVVDRQTRVMYADRSYLTSLAKNTNPHAFPIDRPRRRPRAGLDREPLVRGPSRVRPRRHGRRHDHDHGKDAPLHPGRRRDHDVSVNMRFAGLGVIAAVIATPGCAAPSAAPALPIREQAPRPSGIPSTTTDAPAPTSSIAGFNPDLPPLPPSSPPVVADRPAVRTTFPDQRLPQSISQNDFDRDAALAALSRVRLTGCRTFEALSPGAGTAEVVFDPSGAVRFVRVEDSLWHTDTGACIERRLSRVRVAPFAGASQTVRHSFVFD